MENKKENNSTMWVIILIIGLIVLAIVGYFTFIKSRNDNNNNLAPNTNENTDIDMGTNGKETDVTGSYSSDNDSLADDIKDALDTDNDANNTVMELVLDNDRSAKIARTSNVVDGTYIMSNDRVVVTVNGANNNTTNNNVANDTSANNTNDNTMNNNANNNTTNNMNTSKTTYEFIINSDDTLSYNDDNGKTITLKKISKSNLKYIK